MAFLNIFIVNVTILFKIKQLVTQLNYKKSFAIEQSSKMIKESLRDVSLATNTNTFSYNLQKSKTDFSCS